MLFPKVHVNVSKRRSVFFAHGSAFNLKKSLIKELKVVASECDFKKFHNVIVRSVSLRVFMKSFLNALNAIRNWNVSIK